MRTTHNTPGGKKGGGRRGKIHLYLSLSDETGERKKRKKKVTQTASSLTGERKLHEKSRKEMERHSRAGRQEIFCRAVKSQVDDDGAMGNERTNERTTKPTTRLDRPRRLTCCHSVRPFLLLFFSFFCFLPSFRFPADVHWAHPAR